MSLPAYPSIRSQPTRSSWSIDRYLDPIKTEMEGGNARLRRRPGDDVAVITQTIRFSQSDYDSFVTFVRDTISGGTGRFTMDVWLGSSFVNKTVQFEGKPSASAAGPMLNVSMKLRVFGVG